MTTDYLLRVMVLNC